MSTRYFLRLHGLPEHEVTKEQWVQAERAAGFINTLGLRDEPATAGWSSGGVSGRVEGFDDELNPVVLARLRQLQREQDGAS